MRRAGHGPPYPDRMPSPGRHPSRRSSGSRTRRLLAAGLGAGVLLAVGACGGDDASAGPGEGPGGSPSASDPGDGPTASDPASASPSTSPTDETSPSAPATSQGPPDGSGSDDLASGLLTAAELPGLNADSPWAAGRTRAVDDEAFGWCSRFGPLTAGAVEGVQRGFTSPGAGDDVAAQQVLDLVDQTNARRTVEVYRGWHDDCRRGGTDVRPIQSVQVSGGTAWWYLSSRPTDDGEWEAFGLAQRGSRVTVLRMEHAGQDHSYPPGQDPLERALETAAARLG